MSRVIGVPRTAKARRARFHRALPQAVHVMLKGKSVSRACGETTGGFIRERDADYLKKFLRDGGGLCRGCRKTPEVQQLLKEIGAA